ncbi:MAG: ABC transporter substrate-binding protein [Sediminibacterium sp.]|jgi:peptide/nickel transport system substrate-binding protein|nr:ABC transporter substrate-binding protein [Sediminibacterium sp.]
MTKNVTDNRQKLFETLTRSAADGRLDRREFLALSSVLGLSAAAGLGALPGVAQAQTPKRGGVLRVGQQVLAINDPRVYDWPQKSNVARQFCEPLVRWQPDGSFTPSLLESWEVSDDAKTYTLKVRHNATWTNGDAFTADDVVFNIRRMADANVEGNSMAARLVALRDGEAKTAAEDAVVKLDDFTVQLNLRTPDITLIPSFGDYPALCVHPSFPDGGDLAQAPIGTGAFELVSFEVGVKAVLKRRENGAWWGGEALLDGIEFLDLGTDESAFLAAFSGGEIDMNDDTSADFAQINDDAGLVRETAVTATTVVARMNTQAAPFSDQKVRQAIQLAVDNAVVLELGAAGLGSVAENHHVAPVHPEYAQIAKVPHDPTKAMAMLTEAGQAETEIELISLDEGLMATTSDAIAGQLRDAGIKVKRTVLPGSTFWDGWTKYPFSTTSWGARPLGVQIYALAYRTGEAWNESAHSNPDFDAKLDEALGIFDPDKRRPLMAEMEKMLQDSGVIIQPYWSQLIMHRVEAVRGYQRHPLREMHLEAVWLDR